MSLPGSAHLGVNTPSYEPLDVSGSRARVFTAMVPETRYVRSPEGMIAYQVMGAGSLDLVYLSGGTSHVDMRWELPAFERFLRRLASFSRLILFDRRGTGASDPTPRNSPSTWEEWVDDLRVVLDAAGSQRTAILATLDGGPMAMLFAAAHPERVSALVLVNTTAKFVASDDYPEGFSTDAFDGLVSMVESGWGTESFAELVSPGLVDDPAAKTWFAKYMRASATPRAYAAQLRGLIGLDVRPALPLIQVPTLIMHRESFAMGPIEQGRYLAEHIPGARFVALPGRDSLLIGASDVESILDAVEEFLTGAKIKPKSDRVLATVLFTDLVNSTHRAAEVGDRAWREILDRHDEIARTQVEASDGRMLKTTGDGVLATFSSPSSAIRCALAIRTAFGDLGLEARFGLHTGEIELRGEDVGGIAVAIAARIVDAAGGGEVLVSETIPALVAGSDQQFAPRGTHALKGVPGDWRLYAVDA